MVRKQDGRIAWMVLVAALGVTGCAGGNEGTQTPQKPMAKALAALVNPSGCDEVLTELKKKTIEQMETRLDETLKALLEHTGYSWCYMEDGATGGYGPPSGTNGGTDKSAATEYSTTNTQEAGVDEADFIKNDAKYFYVAVDGRLQILDAYPGPTMHKVSEVEVEGNPTMLYVTGDRALVYSQVGPVQATSTDVYGPMGGYYYGGSNGLCTYGYDCEFTGDGQKMKITVFDLSADRTQIQKVREVRFNGSYLNSRRLGKVVHSVVLFPEVSVPGVKYWPDELKDIWQYCGQTDAFSEEELKTWFAALKEQNRKIIQDADIAAFLPSIEDTRYGADGQPVTETGLLGECKDFYLSQTGDGRSFLSLASLDMTDLGAIGVTTIVGRPGAVYASTGNLYVAARHYQSEMTVGWFYDESQEIQEATTVHKFRLGTGIETQYAGSGAVKGHVLNQFSMDEQDGYLRIATTLGRVPDPRVYSTVAVMAESKGELVIVGMADHIGPDEDIRSARFEGKKGFLVTFKKTDPVWVLDLSDPQMPVVQGELQIPGFSTYMHLMDENHLLAVGFDANDHGDFAYFDGVQVQILDVTDPTKPTQLHKIKIATRGTTSEALTNHLAFNWFGPKKLLALPMMVCEGGGDGSFGDQLTFNGLMVWRVTLESGFELLGGIPRPLETAQEQGAGGVPQAYNPTCSQWWSQASSQVKRSVIMDDWVYSVALDLVQAAGLSDLAHPVAEVSLED